MPVNYALYPPDWLQLREQYLTEAQYRCEGSPHYPQCRAKQHEPHPATGSVVVLALCHVDQDISNNTRSNLRIWCQRCHLRHDLGQHVESRVYGRNHRIHQLQFPFVGQLRVVETIWIPINLQLYISQRAWRRCPPVDEQGVLPLSNTL